MNDQLKDKIKAVLREDNIELEDLTQQSIDELAQQISVYHQELYYQNQELLRTQSSLRDSENMFKSLFYNAPIPYVIYDEHGTILMLNHSFETLINDREANIIRQDIAKYVHVNDQDQFYIGTRKVLKNKTPVEIEIILVNSQQQHFDIQMTSSYWKHDNQSFILSALLNITELNNRTKEIEQLSIRDQLTDLFNRRYYENAIVKIDNELNYPITIMMADVNGLKIFNDTFGHEVGDELLRVFSQSLKSVFRENEIITRTGGDEFVVILPRCNEVEAEQIANRLIKKIENVEVNKIKLSVAVGYATKENAHQHLEQIHSLAENRMYRNKTFMRESKRNQIITSMLQTLHERFPNEKQHSERISELSVKVANEMNFSPYKINRLKTACLLHDIGKIAIESSILNKEGPLDKQEREIVQKHPEIGYRILKSVPEFSSVAEIILFHHERVDGKGYPEGLTDKSIPIESKIISVVDSYDAMVSSRPYRKNPLTHQQAINELITNSGTQFDNNIVNIFIKIITP